MTIEESKTWAKQNYKKYQWKVLGAVVVANIISSISANYTYQTSPTTSVTISICTGLLGFFLTIGLAKFMMNLINDKQADFELLFSKFDKSWKQTIVTCILQYVWVFLYTLLLIIPGIIKSFAYSLVPYILAEGTDKSAKEVLDLSEKMMSGHKMDYFVLNLSFIGWHLLAILTLGILELWIIPYQQTANTKFLYNVMTNYKE